MAFLITTTGIESEVVFEDLGGRSFLHPTIDHDLSLEYTYAELNASKDLQEAIDGGDIIVKDENGNDITQVQSLFGSDYYFSHSDKNISTTTIKYEKVHVLEFEITIAGKYRVSCAYQYRYYGEKGIGFQSRVLLDGNEEEGIIFENGTSNFYLADEKDYIPISIFDYVDMSAGQHILVLEMSLRLPEGVEKKGAVGYIKDMKLELWRVR